MELNAHYILFFKKIQNLYGISGEDPQMKLLRAKSEATASGSLQCQAQWAYSGLLKFGLPTFWFQVQSSGSQAAVGSAVRSPHTASPPCFQLLHHIKRQLKIHTFLILLFQVSNCCTCHKDVI